MPMSNLVEGEKTLSPVEKVKTYAKPLLRVGTILALAALPALLTSSPVFADAPIDTPFDLPVDIAEDPPLPPVQNPSPFQGPSFLLPIPQN